MTSDYQTKWEEFNASSLEEKRETILLILKKIKKNQPNLESLFEDIRGDINPKNLNTAGERAGANITPADMERWKNTCSNGGSASVQIGDYSTACGQENQPQRNPSRQGKSPRK